MDLPYLILEYLKVIAWPIVVIIIISVFHNNLSNLIDRIQKFKGPGGIEIQAELMKNTQEKIVNNPELKKEDEDVLFTPDHNILFDTSISDNASSLYSLQSSLSSTKDKNKSLIIELNESKIHLHFEKISSYMFGSQIKFLELLYTKQNMSKKELENFYTSLIEKYFVFLSWSSDEFIKYMLFYKLIEIKNIEISITQKGINFIKYLNSHNYLTLKPY